MHTDLILGSILPIVGGILGIFFPRPGIFRSRKFIAALHMERFVPELFFSTILCRLAGAIVLIFGLVILLIGLFS